MNKAEAMFQDAHLLGYASGVDVILRRLILTMRAFPEKTMGEFAPYMDQLRDQVAADITERRLKLQEEHGLCTETWPRSPSPSSSE